MKYALSDLPALLRTPLGRRQIRSGLRYRMFPWLAALARRHRRAALAQVRLVAVVGSFGKTTATRFTKAALGQERCEESNHNSFWGLARAVLDADPAVPELVIEAGINRPGEMARYANFILPDITVVTSVGSEHREYLKDLNTTRHEKAFMVRALPADGVAVLNGDDENVLWMASQTDARVITFGLQAHNDVRASGIETDWPQGTRFQLHIGTESYPVQIRPFGRPMVYSALAGVAAAHAAGRKIGSVLAGIAGLSPTPGRLCPVPLQNGSWLLEDSFKSPAETMLAALETLQQCQAKHRFVVMGPVPEYTRDPGAWYPVLARKMAEVADRVLLLGGAYKPFVEAAEHEGLLHDRFIDGGYDILGAADRLRGWIGPGDIVLLKGYCLHTERIALRLTGHAVGCDLPRCEITTSCRTCPMRERGWQGARPVM